MKTNEAPERIYIGLIPSISGGYVYTTVNKDFPNAVEYIRTDTFIEKACDWLQNHTMKELCMEEEDSGLVQEFIENFEDYMKGE